MILERFDKQPVEFKDYDIDYREWLSPMRDKIVEVEHTIRALGAGNTLTVDSSNFTDQIVKLWVGGGQDGDRYVVEVNVTTEGGRVDQSELAFRIKEI